MNICTDAGFLIGLYDNSDEHHTAATQYFTNLFRSGSNRLVIPWPILYETVSSRTARWKSGLLLFQRHWHYLLLHQQLELISDVPFREALIEECFHEL